MKNKKVLYILLLQISCVVLTVAILLFIKYFCKDTFLKVKEKHNEYFGEETEIYEEENAVATTAVPLSYNEINTLCLPVKSGVVTSNFGYRNDPFTDETAKHYGTDIAADEGTKIYSAASGRVISVGFDKNGYGNFFKIDHGGFVTLYGHCSEINVKEGEYVNKGQPVARVGNTGRSTGNHLHFELIIGGKPVNALWYLEF